jgi:Trypsin
MNRSLCALVAGWLCASMSGCSSYSSPEQAASAREPLSGGTVDGADLAVGLLFSHGPPGYQPANTKPLPSGVPWVNESCTGELIAPDVVLTAGHCFDAAQGEQDLDPHVRMDSFYVGQGTAIESGDDNWEPATANMQKFTVDAFVRPSNYAPSSSCPPSDLDVAVAHLAMPVPGVTPLGIAKSAPPAGASVTTVGFGIHPTSAGAPDGGVLQCCVESCVVDCTCLQSTCGCKNITNYGGVCLCNDPTTNESYDFEVKRTASVTIVEVLPQYLHQTDVSQSTDLAGDSGGAVLYGGVVVGTDDCGSGCASMQTDQYFVRIDVAHDWIVSQVEMFDGDAAVGGNGAPGDASAGPEASGSTSSSSSGSSSSGGSSSTSGGTSATGSSGGVPAGGGSGGGYGSASASSGSDTWTGTADAGTGATSGCAAAGLPGSVGSPETWLVACLVAMGALARRARRARLPWLLAPGGAILCVSLGACAGSTGPGLGDDGGFTDETGSSSSSSGGFASSSGATGSSTGGSSSSGSHSSSSGGTTGSSSGSTSGGSSSTSGSGSGSGGGLPGFDGGLPGFDGSFPGWDGSFPGFDGDIPGLDGGLPGFDF